MNPTVAVHYGELIADLNSAANGIGLAIAQANASHEALEYLKRAHAHVINARDLCDLAAEALEREYELNARHRYARETEK